MIVFEVLFLYLIYSNYVFDNLFILFCIISYSLNYKIIVILNLTEIIFYILKLIICQMIVHYQIIKT
jgi:hypothetical protein